jgi:hypothetical protein
MKILSCILVLFYVACKSSPSSANEIPEQFPKNEYAIRFGWYDSNDTTGFLKVAENLYRGDNQQLYFLSFYKPKDHPEKKEPIFIQRFYDYMYYEDEGDSVDDLVKTIDVASFKKYPDGFYRDKHHKYEFVNDDNGGIFKIVQNDDSSFKALAKGFYRGADSNMYIRTAAEEPPPSEKCGKPIFRKVPFIDIATYDDFGQIDGYAKDKNHVYQVRLTTDGKFIDLIKDADPATFNFSRKTVPDSLENPGGK